MKESKEELVNKDIEFETGLLKVDEESISLQWGENNISMYRWQIGRVDVQTLKELRLMPIMYGFRLGAIAIVPIILSFVFKNHFMSWIGTIMMCSAFLIVFGDIFGRLFGLTLIESILMRIIGNEFTEVRVQNTSGQDMEFYILPEEKSKTRSIANLRIEKKEKIESSVTPTTSTANESNLDKLKKIGELYKSGLLSEEEFNQKKSELL